MKKQIETNMPRKAILLGLVTPTDICKNTLIQILNKPNISKTEQNIKSEDINNESDSAGEVKLIMIMMMVILIMKVWMMVLVVQVLIRMVVMKMNLLRVVILIMMVVLMMVVIMMVIMGIKMMGVGLDNVNAAYG